MILKFGKHAGKHISEVPDDYIDWMIRDSEEKATVYKAERERRKYKIDNSKMMKILDAGFNACSAYQEFASPADRDQLKKAYDMLKKAIVDAGSVQS